MAYFFSGQSHTFNEYLLVPGYSSSECIPDNVSLRTPLTRFRAGEEPALSLNVPMVSAVMQSVSGDRLAVALAQEGGVSFLYGSQSIEDEAAMVARVKSYKAGFVRSDSNISPDATLSDILALREQTGHSTVAVTEDGTADGRLQGNRTHGAELFPLPLCGGLSRPIDLSLCRHLCGADPEYRRRWRPHRGDLGMRGIYGVAVFYPVQNGQPCKIHLRLPLRDFGP